LNAHGLIKVRAAIDDRSAREAAYAELCTALEAAPVQHIGKLFILWRPMPEKVKERAEDAKPMPRLVKLVKASKNKNNRPKVTTIKLLGNQRITPGGIVKRAKPKQKSVKK
jgi:hypothetical protein